MSWGIVASVGGTIIGGLMQSDAAGNAAQIQGQSSQAAIDEQKRQYDQSRSDLKPYRDVGGAAVTKLGELMGLSGGALPVAGVTGGDVRADPLNPGAAMTFDQFQARFGQPVDRGWSDVEMANLRSAWNTLPPPPAGAAPPASASPATLMQKFTTADFEDDPVTQLSMKYGLDRGTRAIEQNASRSGMRHSGNTIKAMTQFGQDYAGSKAGDSYNRFYADQDRTFNRLSGLSGTGQTATINTANLGAGTANNVGNIMTAQGNARGAAAIAGGNAMSGALTNVGNWWNNKQAMDRVFPRGGGYSGGTFGGYGGGGSTWYGDNPEY